MDRSQSLAVESQDFCETLGHEHLEAHRGKLSDDFCVLGEVTTRECWVGQIKEWHELLLLHELHDLIPFLFVRVHTGWVVGACVQ